MAVSKRKKTAKKTRVANGGRYTPPKSKSADTSERAQFWSAYEAAGNDLRGRCDKLLDDPTSDEEWQESDLLGMGGQDASDEELISYWATHRSAIDLDPSVEFLPELAFVTESLQSGRDPVQHWAQTNQISDDD